MRGQELKKGDTVCLINAAKNDYEFVAETTIKSAGKKYITTEYNGDKNKFDAQTHHSEFCGYIIYKGTKEECEEYVKARNEAKKLKRKIISHLEWGEPDPKIVKQIYQMIFGEEND